MQYKVGMNIVYPGHGVGKIERIETKEILGSKHKFFCAQIYDSGMKIMVPIANAETIGVRPIATKAEAKKALSIVANKEKMPVGETWNKRYREYMEQIKTGNIFEIAKVLNSIVKLRATQELSFGERKMLDNARSLLAMEISLALNMSKDETLDLMSEAG